MADDAEPVAKKGPSIIIQVAVLLVMTGAALGAGWFVGGFLKKGAPEGAAVADTKAPDDGHAKADDGHGAAADAGHGEDAAEGEEPVASTTLFNLPPITTNLAAPSDIWARMEVSIRFDTPPADVQIVEAIHQDLLGFLRTVKMHQIEGASGIQHFKSDLEERALIRSDGHVKNVYIRTLLFE